MTRKQGCSVRATLDVIGGRWKPLIVFHLTENETLRFSELQRLIPDVTQRMLTRQLRELEADRILCREIFREVPPHVEYSLSAYGRTLIPVLEAMCEWGQQHAH